MPIQTIAPKLSEADTSQVIAMAWDDDTPFEAIARTYGLSESDVIALMRQSLKFGSFKVWRTKVRGRASKHQVRKRLQTLHVLAQASMVIEPITDDIPMRTTHITREGLK
jgi:uncharacterized protein (TIGR03643 family)